MKFFIVLSINFQSLLEDTDSLLYVDTDTVFLTSPEKIWAHFANMTSTQMAAVTPEHEDYSTGWYNRFARHPYYGNLGEIFLSSKCWISLTSL